MLVIQGNEGFRVSLSKYYVFSSRFKTRIVHHLFRGPGDDNQVVVIEAVQCYRTNAPVTGKIRLHANLSELAVLFVPASLCCLVLAI
jgi:hypothetical protein